MTPIAKDSAGQKEHQFNSSSSQSFVQERRDESKGGFQRVVKRSLGPISRVPGEDRVAVRVGVAEMGKGNDQKSQGLWERSVASGCSRVSP